jgi:hypothetical protein
VTDKKRHFCRTGAVFNLILPRARWIAMPNIMYSHCVMVTHSAKRFFEKKRKIMITTGAEMIFAWYIYMGVLYLF